MCYGEPSFPSTSLLVGKAEKEGTPAPVVAFTVLERMEKGGGLYTYTDTLQMLLNGGEKSTLQSSLHTIILSINKKLHSNVLATRILSYEQKNSFGII